MKRPKMYQDERDKFQQDDNLENMDRLLDHYSNIDFMTSWIIGSPSGYPTSDAENPWADIENIGYGLSAFGPMQQQSDLVARYQTSASQLEDLGIYNKEGKVEPMDIDEVEPQSPYVVLLDSRQINTGSGTTITTPWIYLWKVEKLDSIGDRSSPPIEDVKLERARYVKNPEMQAAKAFYNALQLLRRTVQANETELSPNLRTHHERTNCEEQMLQSFTEYDAHASQCSSCCSALINAKRKIPLCELGTVLAEQVFLAIDWYATATFGDYKTVTLEVSSHSVWSLLLAFTQEEFTTSFESEEVLPELRPENAPIQTLAVESLGIISSFLGIEDKTSVIKRLPAKRKGSGPSSTTIYCGANAGYLWENMCQNDLLATNAELVVSTLDEYLNSPSRRRVLRSRIGQEGMRSIRRLFNVSLHGYNALERAFGDSIEEDYDFYHDFPNHADLLSLGVQTFIELSNEKPSYPTALKEVYSILHLCDSINQVMPQQNLERKRRTEGFTRELKDWRNIIESRGERDAFELIVQVRWPSKYLQPSRRGSAAGAKRIKSAIDKYSVPDRASLERPERDVSQASRNIPNGEKEDPNPMTKALLWMQLIAGIAFTTIAAFFSLNHRIVNVLVLYLTGGIQEILNSSRTIDNTSTHLPNNLAWISSSSITFIEKVRGHIIEKLRVPEFENFSHAVDVAMDSLSCGWISTINGLESLLLRLAKLVECTKLEFYTFVEKVLDLCMICAANMPTSQCHRIAPKESRVRYTSSYRQLRLCEEKSIWAADEDEETTKLQKAVARINSNSKSNPYDPIDTQFSGPFSPAAATYASSRSPDFRIKSEFIDEVLMSTEDRLLADGPSPFQAEDNYRDLLGGPIAAYPSMLPPSDPVLTVENHDDLFLSPPHYQPQTSKGYSEPGMYHPNLDLFWNPPRSASSMSSLPEHTMAPSWQLSGDLLNFAEPSLHYYPASHTSVPASIPTSIPMSIPTSIAASISTSLPTYAGTLKPLVTSSIAASPISPLPLPDETPRFLPAAPTPPPPVPPAKPRKRRRSSPTKDEGEGGQQPPSKRQKKTMFFRCQICKHDIAAPRMNLTRHVRTVHADSRQCRITCEWPGCETTFQAARKDNYRAHLRKHQEKLGEGGNGV
ncbi:hypothetical protein ABW19_dt0206616 [Dactylella cylindrospora]|nr:hypothetical protein ABW19_dt0206616 [Dactylella cylindrospora]